MRKKFLVGTVYGFIHFSVEVASFYFLFSRMATSPIWWAFALFFDAFAFLPQGILGSITDRFPKVNLGLLGGLLMLTALLIKGELFPLFLLAFGNAMIHVAGAQHTLRESHGKITPNAIFVGGGSFGVITGQLLGGVATPALLAIPLSLMVLSCVAICIIHKKDTLDGKFATFAVSAPRPGEIIVLCAFIGVVVRAYTAYAIPTEWNKTVPQAIAMFVCMGIGKTLGGVLCDRLGFRPVALISLLGGLPFLLAGNDQMVLSLIGVAMFSMTMPITVAILASVFPKRPGFAFGITTTGLFLGSAPAFFIRPETLLSHQLLVIILTAAALPAILISIKKGG